MSVNNASFEFGRDRLGPIFAHFLSRLDQTIRYFEDERNAKVLFVSRAGVRLRRLHEMYAAAVGREPSRTGDYLWTSRLMTLKGTWSSQNASVIRQLSEEFQAGTISDLVAALLRDSDQEWRFDPSRPEVQRPASDFGDFIWGASEVADLVRWHLADQSEFFDDYVRELLGDHETALLVDSGWQGTAQTLLSDWRSDVEWWGAYFGRIGTEKSDRRYWHRMLGLVFEADEPDPRDPSTSIVGHRHMIELALEPRGPSIERLARLDDDSIEAPQAAAVLASEPVAERDAIYLGVEAYIAGLNTRATPGRLLSRAQANWPSVARTLLFPTRAEAEAISGGTRSADYGRSLTVPMVLPAKARREEDSAEQRIAESLWPAAQVALEYPSPLAEARQAQMWGFKPDKAWPGPLADAEAQVVKPPPAPSLQTPKVAIITRTLDRIQFLQRAIDSVRRQTYRDYVHVIVSDGGDPELVQRAINESSADLRRTILVDNVVNRGMEAASNFAIGAADSEYIVIHDDDDTWEPEFLEKTVAFLDSARGAKYAGVITNTWHISEEVRPDGIEVFDRKPFQGEIQNVSLMEMAISNIFAPICFLFRRSVYDAVGGFDPSLPVLGDWDFNLKVLAQGDIGVVPDRLANYHHRDRGGPGLFANSIIGGVSKHAEYDPIVRNRLVRRMGESGSAAGLAVLVNLGQTLNQMRSSSYRIEQRAGAPGRWSQAPSSSGSSQPPAELLRLLDDRWLALTVLTRQMSESASAAQAAAEERDHAAHHDGGSGRGGASDPDLQALAEELAETKKRLRFFEQLADERWVGLAVASGAPRQSGASVAARALLGRVRR